MCLLNVNKEKFEAALETLPSGGIFVLAISTLLGSKLIADGHDSLATDVNEDNRYKITVRVKKETSFPDLPLLVPVVHRFEIPSTTVANFDDNTVIDFEIKGSENQVYGSSTYKLNPSTGKRVCSSSAGDSAPITE